ncbi:MULTISPECIES: pseudouridine synthase [Lactococcus]|uniref:pseudouridine synthase n=1 Tax=Lactococcus TaxID=1357 RepID=UPI000EC2C075|nr:MULTISPECIES: pseudouridine synthase [Lactococcus]MBL3716011.1 pseudouridine synthase [Lactococcus garvieae]HAP14850.1 16S rRNA pseudouridine(516) synthase [Lactococcus sp.]
MRLDKYLAEAGLGSRKEVKAILKTGKVTVNDVKVKDGKQQVELDKDSVSYDGQPLAYQEFYYYLLNKPAGVVSATKDNLDKTVVQLLKTQDFREDIFPVGRLDKDTEGLLLLTNDGALSHNLLSPKKHVEKEYFAQIQGQVTQATVREFAAGLTLKSGENVKPGQLFIEKSEGNKGEIRLIIHEGKFHQVKRMFEAVGMKVTYLKRLRMGSLKLDEALALGEYRALTDEEITKLKDESGKKAEVK